MYPAFLCVYVRICAYMCVYVLKCLIFKQLLKIANIGENRYTKSLQIRKIAVPLLLETGTKPKPKSSLKY